MPPEQIALTAVVASFTDDDPNGNFTASINSGDGTSSVGSISANTSGGFDVAGDHTLCRAGQLPRQRGDPRRRYFDRRQYDRRGASTARGKRRGSPCLRRKLVHRRGRDLHRRPSGFAGDFTAIVDWGDNSSSAGTVSAIGGRRFQCHRDAYLCGRGSLRGSRHHQRTRAVSARLHTAHGR